MKSWMPVFGLVLGASSAALAQGALPNVPHAWREAQSFNSRPPTFKLEAVPGKANLYKMTLIKTSTKLAITEVCKLAGGKSLFDNRFQDGTATEYGYQVGDPELMLRHIAFVCDCDVVRVGKDFVFSPKPPPTADGTDKAPSDRSFKFNGQRIYQVPLNP